MKIIIFTLFLCISFNVFAKKTLKAHSHDGVLKVKLVVNKDGKSLALELESSGDSLLGFEKKPTSKFQKSVYKTVKETWENEFKTLVLFAEGSNCRVLETSFNMEFETHEEEHGHHHKKKHTHEEHHSEVLAKANISCAKSIASTETTIKMKSIFNQKLRTIYEKNKKKRHHFVGKVDLEVMPATGKPFVKKSKRSSFKIKI